MEDKTTMKNETKERRCSELESKCVELGSEIEKKKTEYEELEAKYRELEAEKNVIEEELNALKGENKRNEMSSGREREKVVDLTEDGEGEEDGVVQLMIENKVLECEKRRAESEVEFLKQKLKEFESMVLNEPIVLQTGAGAPCNVTPSKRSTCTEGEKGVYLESKSGYHRRVKKPLALEEDRSPSKKLAPSTPSGVRIASLGVIDICDSDDEPDVTHVQPPSVDNHGNGNTCISTDHSLEGIMGSEKEFMFKENSKRVIFQCSYEENMDNCDDSLPFICTAKRKRASNIVTSDTESDDDDVPICKLKRINIQETVSGQASSKMKSCSVTAAPSGDDNIENLVTPPRRHLVSLRKYTGKSSSSKTHEIKCEHGTSTAEDVQGDKSEDAGSESEGESLNGFIVDTSEESDLNATSSEVADSDDNVDFDEILSTLNRSKDQKLEWEFEADMLAAFGKNPELCMKAVCALYRQQTSEEKVSRGTLVYNYRGFSKFDAKRGTILAEFLTDGDPLGALKKSVEELHKYNRKAVEMCRTFATHYSKQLFEIYKNKEDPLFS